MDEKVERHRLHLEGSISNDLVGPMLHLLVWLLKIVQNILLWCKYVVQEILNGDDRLHEEYFKMLQNFWWYVD